MVREGIRPAPRARYLPVGDQVLIGDLQTVALVGTDGTIDWYCCPRFDSPSVFAAILDADHGGLFRVSPNCEGWSSKQLYLVEHELLVGSTTLNPWLPGSRSRTTGFRDW